VCLAGQELLRLPIEHGVRQALERLSQHDVLPRSRVQCAQMQV
jgi:hypothetical protein